MAGPAVKVREWHSRRLRYLECSSRLSAASEALEFHNFLSTVIGLQTEYTSCFRLDALFSVYLQQGLEGGS